MYSQIKSRLDLVYFLHNHLFSFTKARPNDFIRVVNYCWGRERLD